jgi:hypothetical protein
VFGVKNLVKKFICRLLGVLVTYGCGASFTCAVSAEAYDGCLWYYEVIGCLVDSCGVKRAQTILTINGFILRRYVETV